MQRSVLIVLVVLAATAVAAEPPAHHAKRGFQNPFADHSHGGLFGIVRARLSADWQSYDAARDQVPTTQPNPVDANQVSDNAAVTWIGHATVLVQHRGINLLTDPMFARRASPLGFVGPARITAPAIPIEELPEIHAVVLSHDHYDHLDTASIRALGNGPMYFVPLGLADWFVRKGIAAHRVMEMDWWDEHTLETVHGSLTITATPSQHFSGRGLTDRNASLWASWHIAWDDFSVWFGGDTGYNDTQFKAIGRRFGAVDLGIIPIGAYAPRWFMKTVHVDPAEALKIHKDVRARRSMGIHWGAFILSGEGVLTPLADLHAAREQAALERQAFSTFAVGETRRYQPVSPVSPSSQSGR